MPQASERARMVSQEAAYWYLRCFDEQAMSRSDRKKFVAWLRLSPENVAEFLRVADVDGELARRRLREFIGDWETSNVIEGDFGGGAAQYDYQPSDTVSDEVLRQKKSRSIRGMAAALAVCTVTLLVGFVVFHENADGVVQTLAAEWKHVTLDDGSTVYLDARTRLKVDFTPERRLVHLYHGWAVFEVVKDSRRPFTVSTDPINVTAVGTRFGVAIDNGVTTTVQEGTVEVNAREGRDGASVLVHKGQELHVQPAGTLALSEAGLVEVDARRKLLWVTGRLQLTDTTIGEIVRQFNRRQEIQADIEDPELANRPIDLALMQVDNVDDFIEVMESRGVTVSKDGSTLTLRATRLE